MPCVEVREIVRFAKTFELFIILLDLCYDLMTTCTFAKKNVR